MNKIWFTSDLHFSHNNILKFQPESRPFANVDDMNEAIIYNHNNVVDPDDTVYILGDVAFCNASQAIDLVNRMNGNKHLIVGNHDRKLIETKEFRQCFITVRDYRVVDVIHEKKKLKYVLFHFPIYEWERCHHHARHLHGHVHGHAMPGMIGKSYDVGLDSPHLDGTFLRPFDVDELEYLVEHKVVLKHGTMNNDK